MSISLLAGDLAELAAEPKEQVRTDTLRKVELPEGVEIHVRVAGPIARALAWLIDFSIVAGLYMVLGILVNILSLVLGEDGATGILYILLFLVTWFYDVVFEVFFGGATLGKRALGLRVVTPTGAPITWTQSFVRNLLRWVDYLPFGYFIGLHFCLLSKNFQRLGDLAAGTVVVYAADDSYLSAPLPENIQRVPPSVQLDREEQRAIVAFSDRAGLWSEGRLLELSNHLEPLTKVKDRDGYAKLIGMAAWLRDST